MDDPTPSDEEVIRRALRAAVDGPYFDDAEFHTLFGLSREDVRRIGDAWPQQPEAGIPGYESAGEVQRVAVDNALNNLLGYPHGFDRRLVEEVGVGRRELALVLGRWRGEASDPTTKGYVDGLM